MLIKTTFAVVVAGVLGSLANAAAAALFLNPALFMKLATVPNRYIIAILFAAAIPVIYRLVRGSGGAVLALAFLTIAPSALAKFGLGAMTAWTTVLALNFVFGLAALVAYRLVRR